MRKVTNVTKVTKISPLTDTQFLPSNRDFFGCFSLRKWCYFANVWAKNGKERAVFANAEKSSFTDTLTEWHNTQLHPNSNAAVGVDVPVGVGVTPEFGISMVCSVFPVPP